MSSKLSDLEAIGNFQLSSIEHHGEICCEIAMRQILALLDCYGDVGSQLANLPELIRWGPVVWPIHWCGLENSEGLVGDCGVHADIAARILNRFKLSYSRGQAVIVPSKLVAEHWKSSWSKVGASDKWIFSNFVYHEVVHIGARWWDPTEACWFEGEDAFLKAGRVLAVRIEGGPWKVSESFNINLQDGIQSSRK